MKKFLEKNADLIGLLGLGMFLRLKDILKYDLWYDEAFTGLMMKVPFREFREILSKDPHPPFFMLLMRGWTEIVGVTDFTLRIPSVIFGCLTIFLIYLSVKEMFNKKAAVIAALLAAINPFLIAYSIEARSYALFGLVVITCFYLLLKEKHTAFALILVIMINIHYMGLIFLPGLILSYFVLKRNRTKIDLKKDLLRFIPVIISAIYIATISRRQQEVLNADWIRETSFLNLIRTFTAQLFGVESKATGRDALYGYNLPLEITYIGGALMLLAIVGLIIFLRKAKREEKSQTGIVLMNLLLPQLLLISYSLYEQENLYVERYMLPTSIFLLILLGTLMVRVSKFETMTLILIMYIGILFQIKEPSYYNGMKKLQEELSLSNQRIIFTNPIDFVIGKYYLYPIRRNLGIYDPQNPDWDYAWWPFIEPGNKAQDLHNALIIIPKEGFVPQNLQRIAGPETYGDYNVYKLAN